MKKHILIISQYFYPEQFRINDMATEWMSQGYKVTVLTGIPNYPQGRFYEGYGWFKKRRESWNGIDIIRIPLFARGRTAIGMILNYSSFIVSGFFWKCFTDVKADFVFTFEVSPMTQALIGVWYAKKYKIPNYLYVQDLWPENVEIVTGIHSKAVVTPIIKMVEYIYKNCDKIFATSPSFVSEIQKRLKNKKDKVFYWPQYAEDFYVPTNEHSKLIPSDKVLNITFTGNIGTAQGLEILPKTARLLKEKGIQVRFNIVGDGRNKSTLAQQIEDHNVREYFNMIEHQPAFDIPGILSASDAAFVSFANNSLYLKTIPAKLQSYMACGCPIIASAGGETKKVVEESMCGLVSDIGSAENLVSSIILFANMSEQQRKWLGNNALNYCKAHFEKNKLMKFIEEQCFDN